MSEHREYIALMGNPNSGKTAIFNLLTSMNLKVSNYPGITVEIRQGTARISPDKTIEIMDLPGTYSLKPESMDETIVAQQTLRWMGGEDRPKAIISVVDAANLSRNLYLTSQLLDMDIPVIVALNMMDRVRRRNQDIDPEALRKLLGVAAVVPMSAREKWGISKLQEALADVQENTETPSAFKLQIPDAINAQLQIVSDFFQSQLGYRKEIALGQSLRVITRKSAVNIYEDLGIISGKNITELHQLRENAAAEIDKLGINHKILEATLRYDALDSALKRIKSLSGKKLSQYPVAKKRTEYLLIHGLDRPFLLLFSMLYFSLFSPLHPFP